MQSYSQDLRDRVLWALERTELNDALMNHRVWYQEEFGKILPEWYIFPFGRPKPSDPTRRAEDGLEQFLE